MYYLKYNNENIFLTKHNKIILTNYTKYYDFVDSILSINKNNSKVELNGLKLNSKNTIVIDLSSISSSIQAFNSNSRLVDEYIKVKLENIIIEEHYETKINEVINELLNNLYGKLNMKNINLDVLKLVKNNSNIKINNSNDFLTILKEILISDNLNNVFIIYKKAILEYLELRDIEYLKNKKLILMEICDKASKFEENDNVLFFDNNILQITYHNLIELILSKLKIDTDNEEVYEYLINRVLFYTIDKREVDIMRKYIEEIRKISSVLKDEFKIDLKETSDYI